MKSFYKLIVSISCLFALSSCEGYLDVEQPSIYTDQNYYKTPQDFETAINGCYAQLQTIYNKNYMEAIVTRADEVRNSTPIGRFMDTPMESKWSKPWSAWWTLVFRCNQLLSRIDAVVFTDEDRKAYITGEAYALRGLAYLQFAWCWGGAPLITKEISREEVYKVARSSQAAEGRQPLSIFGAGLGKVPLLQAAHCDQRHIQHPSAAFLKTRSSRRDRNAPPPGAGNRRPPAYRPQSVRCSPSPGPAAAGCFPCSGAPAPAGWCPPG